MCVVNNFVGLVFTDTVWCILNHNNVLLLSGTWTLSLGGQQRVNGQRTRFI